MTGYRRPDGRVGVRNLVAVISAMDNTNATANRVASIVDGTVALTTPFGRTQIGHDFEMTLKTSVRQPLRPVSLNTTREGGQVWGRQPVPTFRVGWEPHHVRSQRPPSTGSPRRP